MAFPVDSEAAVILELQAIAAGQAGWNGVLGRIATMTGARFAVMLAREAAAEQPPHAVAAMPGGGTPVLDLAAVATVLTERMRPERLYSAEDLVNIVDDGAIAVGEAMAALDAGACLAMRISAPEAPPMVLGLFGSRAFSAADGSILRRLFPYLQAAIRSAAKIGRDRNNAALTADVASRSVRAWFLLDRAERVVDWWIGKAGLPGGLRLAAGPRGHRLVLDARHAAERLATIVDDLGRDGPARSHAVPVASGNSAYLRVARPPSAPMRPDRAHALITLHDPLEVSPDCAALLVDLFELLPSEARLAAALAGGDRLADAAARLGLTIETARNYSKKIFAKTGTRGQPDLVRLILSHGLAAR